MADDPRGWMTESELADGAAITVVRGSDLATVLTAFGADGEPVLPSQHLEAPWTGEEPQPWAVIAQVGDGVMVVEPNGYTGSIPAVLREASQGGVAVLVYWNVNMLTDVEIAENGEIVGGINDMHPHGGERFTQLVGPMETPGTSIDPFDAIRLGLELQQRLTGLWLTSELWQQLQSHPVAYALVPPLPEQYDNRRTWHPEARDLVEPAAAADSALVADLTWQAAAQAAASVAADRHPDVASTLATRSLDEAAEMTARRAYIGPTDELVLWRMLHAATNPDAPTALVTTLADASRMIDDPAFDELLDRIRAALGG